MQWDEIFDADEDINYSQIKSKKKKKQKKNKKLK